MTDDKMRLTSGSSSTSSSTTGTVSGVTTVDSAELVCGCPTPGIETIEVEQVLAAEMAQRVVEFDMVVPSQKPDIEQVVDVYVKDVCITDVDVLKDKVVVRGKLEVKVMYVADLPDQPVHAYEKKDVRWTRDIVMAGVESDMKATADVTVEYVDFDFHHHHNPRLVHITLVLKVWARVTTTTDMDVYTLGVVDQVGAVLDSTTSDTTIAASQFGDTLTSSSHYAAYGAENILVTGPGLVSEAGTSLKISGTATVTGSKVNVRTGPGTNFPVVVQVNKGETVTLKDQAFGWYSVVLKDGTTTGWIASWLLSGVTPVTPKG